MKKTIYTIAFVALFSVMSNAQSVEQQKKPEPAKQENVNPDGTKRTTVAPANADNAKALESPEAQKATPEPKTGTRMAITEKGVPASKKAEPAKTEKH